MRRREFFNKIWKRKRKSKEPVKVGTEAISLANLDKNARSFKYPKEGFLNKIEYSLLYSMIGQPDIYPDEIVKNVIDEEDLNEYLFVADSSSSNRIQEDPVSYAQLSALLALTGEMNPPAPNKKEDQESIPVKLVKRILQCVIKYAEKHDLDREKEINELMDPVQRLVHAKTENAALKQSVPFYIGYTAALVTGNPIPIMLGLVAFAATPEKLKQENENAESFNTETKRAANIETVGLLDEAE